MRLDLTFFTSKEAASFSELPLGLTGEEKVDGIKRGRHLTEVEAELLSLRYR